MDPLETIEKLDGPRVKQFSVFLENKVGALLEVVKLLEQHDVHVLALSIHDSSDMSIVRMVVSDPDLVHHVFHEHEIACSECELLVVEMSGGATDLRKLLGALLQAEVNIHFSYALLTRPNGHTALVLHPEDYECASAVLRANQFKLLSQADISR